MPKMYKISEEQLREIKAARKLNKEKNADKRLEVLEMRGNGEKHSDISAKTGYNQSYVSQIVVKYITLGIESILVKKREANRRNMTFLEEKAFLEQFKELASKGQIITAKEIKIAYEKKIGHSCGNGQIYRLLKRHNCRKLKPRGQHPKKASPEVIEASKKLTLGWEI